MTTRLLIAGSDRSSLAELEARVQRLGAFDVFLSAGTSSAHIAALENREPRAVLLLPSHSAEAFQYLLLKRSKHGQIRNTPTLILAAPNLKQHYESLLGVGQFEIVSPGLPDEAFLEVITRTLKFFDSQAELLRTRESLIESQLELKGLVNAITDGVIVTNSEGIIQRTNPAMCGLLGLQQGDIVNVPFHRLIGDQEVIRMTGLAPIFSDPGGINGMTITFRRRDGSLLPLSVSGKHLPGPEDEVRGYIMVARDVRDTLFLMQNESRDAAKVREEHQALQKSTDEKIEKIQNILHHSERLSQIGQLVAGIGHEINSPLHLIQLSLQDLRQQNERLETMVRTLLIPDEDMTHQELSDLQHIENDFNGRFSQLKESMDMVHAGSERLLSVSSALRIKARREDIFSSNLNINDLIQETITLLKYRLLTVDLDLELNDLPSVAGYGSHITQVLTNILINACDALNITEESPGANNRAKIQIKTAVTENKSIEIRISDNGPGIPEDLRSKVFEDFFTTKGVGKGTGIGLALSRKLIDDHGGTISAGACPTLGGALFRLQLPTPSQIDAKALPSNRLTSMTQLK